MTPFRTLIPERSAFLTMHAAELAGYLLEVLMSAGQMEKGVWNRRNCCGQVSYEYGATGQGADRHIGIACSAAWSWLESNGFICKDPEQDNDWYVATALGATIQQHQQLRQLVSGENLPEHFLHAELLVNVRPLFLQSRLETAVFEAFKAVEVSIRTVAKLGDDMIGVQLASRAFHPDDGVLTNKHSEKGERVALMNLMTGALGSYKNPASHRRVAISTEEARDMIVLASHLLKIIDSRRPGV